MVLHWTFFGILADLQNTVVWMVSTHPFISKSSSPFTNPSVTLPRAPNMTGITITFMFQSFSIPYQSWGTYRSFGFLSILLSGQPEQQSPQFGKFTFSFWLLFGSVVWNRYGDPFVSENPRGVCASHSPGQVLGCTYTIFSYGKIQISCTIHSELITSPSQSSLVTYSFCAVLLGYTFYSFISTWFMLSASNISKYLYISSSRVLFFPHVIVPPLPSSVDFLFFIIR